MTALGVFDPFDEHKHLLALQYIPVQDRGELSFMTGFDLPIDLSLAGSVTESRPGGGRISATTAECLAKLAVC